MLIVYEGTDSASKSTQAQKLYDKFQDEGRDVVLLHQPGGTPLGDHLRSLIKDPPEGMEISRMAERLLFTADNATFVEAHLRDIPDDRIVILDRSTFISDIPYGIACGIDMDDLEKMASLVKNPPKYDLLFLFLLPTEVAVDRMNKRRSITHEKCRIEDRGFQFLDKVNQTYHQLAGVLAHKLNQHAKRWVSIDASASIDDIWKAVEEQVNLLF
jgi:dTMP kinase